MVLKVCKREKREQYNRIKLSKKVSSISPFKSHEMYFTKAEEVSQLSFDWIFFLVSFYFKLVDSRNIGNLFKRDTFSLLIS